MNNVLIQLFLPLSLAFIMFGMGITLTINDFTRIVKYPKAVIIGLMVQLIILPLIAYSLILLFDLDATMAIGMILIASCPGGATSNLVTQICKGNIALSVTLTAITSFITIFTTQIIMSFALSHFDMHINTLIELPIWDTTKQIMLITGIPIIIGMFVKANFPFFTKKAEKPMKTASMLFFILIFAGVIATNFDLLKDAFKRAGSVTLLLNVLIITSGYGIARLLKTDKKSAISIAAEGSIQNATLALVIATTMLHNVEITIPTAAYTIWMYTTSGFLMWMINSKILKRFSLF